MKICSGEKKRTCCASVSSNPWHPCKKPDKAAVESVALELWKTEARRFLGLAGLEPSSGFTESAWLKKIGWKVTRPAASSVPLCSQAFAAPPPTCAPITHTERSILGIYIKAWYFILSHPQKADGNGGRKSQKMANGPRTETGYKLDQRHSKAQPWGHV